MQQRARAMLPARRRTSHAPFRLPSNSCWSSSRTGSRVLVGRQGTVAAYGSRTTRASSEPTIGRMACHRIEAGARRRAATAGGDAEVPVVWTTRCLRLLAAVSHRVL